jgi:hypothetical protein
MIATPFNAAEALFASLSLQNFIIADINLREY